MKILISWMSFNNDFNKEGKVDIENSPNYNMHKLFWNFDKHIILSSAKEDDTRMIVLENQMKRSFPDHDIEVKYMNINDVISIPEIKTKVESLLVSLKNDDITIYFSPGTSAMQVSWYICHTSLGLKTKLVQVRPAAKSKKKQNELLEIITEQSTVPVTSILKEQLFDNKTGDKILSDDYLITESLKDVYNRADKIAQTDKVTVLINGETGTGKEHLAKYIHNNSIRKDKPYITVNCSAFNDELLAAQLFGYKKGAFTGADKDTKGLFEEAEGGTIFLDEIADISPRLQQTLLRVLQQKEIQPLQDKPRKVDVRVIAATNKDLPELCHAGKFRWDLFYRLAIAELELPTLQNRGSKELDEMINYFLRKKSEELLKPKELKINTEVLQFMHNYSWPGNIRELENLIETLYIFCDIDVTIKDIPERFKESNKETSLRWEDIEKAHIEKVLKLKKGNQRQTWLALGYGSINTLRNKIKEYGIDLEGNIN
ncbi:MAG: sigma-54 dependent transcriptional regulator [Bacteroidota bacterium]